MPTAYIGAAAIELSDEQANILHEAIDARPSERTLSLFLSGGGVVPDVALSIPPQPRDYNPLDTIG